MELSQLVSADALAYRITRDPSLDEAYKLSAWFPNQKILGRDLKWLKSNRDVGISLAPSTEDTLPVIRPRGEIEMTKQEMPIFREQMKIDEHIMYEVQRIQSSGDPYAEAIVQEIYRDAEVLGEAGRIAAEWERSQLIAPIDGNVGITIGTKDNTIYKYNYDPNGTWKANHYLALTNTDTWDNSASSAPLDDLQKAVTYLASIGVNARYALMNGVTDAYLARSEQVKSATVTPSGQTISYMTPGIANQVVEQTVGLQVLTYDKVFKDFAGNQQKFYPDNYVTIIGDGALGTQYYGTTAEERTLLGHPGVQVSIADPGMALAIVTEPGPPIITKTTLSMITLPSFEGMDSIFVIKVK